MGRDRRRVRRGRGPVERLARRERERSPVGAPPYLTRKIPPYELLDEEALVRLERHADWVLTEVGIEIRAIRQRCNCLRKRAPASTASVSGSTPVMRGRFATAPRKHSPCMRAMPSETSNSARIT